MPGMTTPALILVLGILVLVVGCGGQKAAPREPPSETTEKGARLYNSYCLSCHGGSAGGSVRDIPPPHNTNGHTWHHPDCLLVDIVLNGTGEMGAMMRQMMGGQENAPVMPAWKGTLTKADVAAILSYIKTWWSTEQRQFQATVTAQSC